MTRALLISLLLLPLCSCAEDAPPAPPPVSEQLARTGIVQPDRSFEALSRPPLAMQEALADPDNVLRADPTPWRPLEATPGGTLRRGVLFLPNAYVWLTNNTISVSDINTYVLESVAIRHQLDPDVWAPSLAEKVEINDDGSIYTITLRPGIRWHRPHPDAWSILPTGDERVPLTSGDFAFTFKMLKDKAARGAAPARSWYSDCVDLVVLDERRFQMVWKRPGLAAWVGTLSFAPIPEHVFAYDDKGVRRTRPAAYLDEPWYVWPIGTGPYELSMESGDDNRSSSGYPSFLRFVRNPNHHGPPPAIDAITYRVLGKEDMIAAVASGDIDIVELPPELYPSQVLYAPPGNPLERGAVRMSRVRELGYGYIAWNLRDGPTTDVRVRRALTHAMNRERIINEAFGGLGARLAGPFPNHSRAAAPGVEPLPFDLLLAAEILEGLGWRDRNGDGIRTSDNGEVLRVTILGFSSVQWQDAMDIFKGDLESIGVEVELVFPDDLEINSRLAVNNYTGYVGGWGLDWENDPFQVWHSSQADVPGSSNRIGYANPVADRLIETIRSERAIEDRIEALHDFYRLLHEEQPYTFVLENDLIFITHPRLRGLRFQRIRPHDNSLPWWIEE